MQSRSSQPDVRTPRTLRGAVEPETIALTDSETYQTLLARAHRRTGGVPSESIVRHVLSVTRGGDWPVARDALDAVLRRCASTHTDDIQIAGRPRGRLLGLYATRGLRARPYRTLLRRIEPLDGSCECADFLRNSLGLCKHLVAVVEEVVSKGPRGKVERQAASDPAPLRWDPVRPLTGPGDWLARVRWMDGTPDRDLRRWLRPAPEGGWSVVAPDKPPRRLALVDRLLGALRDGKSEPALHALLREERARLARQIQTLSTRKRLRHALHFLKQSLYPDDPSCRVLFASDAGGVGLNLQRAASACINIELPWNPAVIEQRIGRIYRLGQRLPIDVYNLVSEPGIESRIADIVGSKQALFTGLFDGTSDEVAFERSGTFLSRLERLVTPALAPAQTRAADVAAPEDAATEREIDAVVAAGDESRDAPGIAGPPLEPMPSAAEIQRLVSGVTVRRTAQGGLVIEAPREAASTLGALFSGMAQLLQAAAAR